MVATVAHVKSLMDMSNQWSLSVLIHHVLAMVVDIMVPSHSVIRSHKAADFFVIFGYCGAASNM